MSLESNANSHHTCRNNWLRRTTFRIARAAFPQGNVYMQLKDEFGNVYEDEAFAHLFPNRGQPAAAPWQLALIALMQFMEGLSDRQAADAIRSRIDWKYAWSYY